MGRPSRAQEQGRRVTQWKESGLSGKRNRRAFVMKAVCGDGRVPRVGCAVCGCSDGRDLQVQEVRAPGRGCVVCVAVDGTPASLWPAPRVG